MLIQELTLQGILSFGPESNPLELRPLNLLIGPNGSGKSNLLDALGILRACPKQLTGPIRGNGIGIASDWIWKGNPAGLAVINAQVRVSDRENTLRHKLAFEAIPSRPLQVHGEFIDLEGPLPPRERRFAFNRQEATIITSEGFERGLIADHIKSDESILSQLKDEWQFPYLSKLSDHYEQLRFYREWSFGRSAVLRSPQPADGRSDRLAEDFSNLGLFLNQLRQQPKVKKTLLAHLKDLYEGIDDFDVSVKGGTVELFLTEGDFAIPANRLSDGTLRYLCLLAILCDPEPPPLICIEEPELGLHPDLIPKIADLLVEASQRTQLVVTTHSDILISALSEQPESVVIVEKHDGQTQMKRLNAAELKVWLEDYRLGQLWLKGQLGGTRW